MAVFVLLGCCGWVLRSEFAPRVGKQRRRRASKPLPQFFLLPRLKCNQSTRRVCACPPYTASSVPAGSMKAAGQGFIINTKSAQPILTLFSLPTPPTPPPGQQRLTRTQGTPTTSSFPLRPHPPPSKLECIRHSASSRRLWPPPLPLQAAARHTSLLLLLLLLLLLRMPLPWLLPCHGTGVNTRGLRRRICGRRDGVFRW